MKIKNKTKNDLLWFALIILIVFVIYLIQNPRIVKVPVKVGVPLQPRPKQTRREPEFRDAPIKKYKPGFMQQMGRLSHSMVKRCGGVAIAIITIQQPVAKISIPYQSPIMREIVWKTLDAKNFMGMKQFQ